MFDRPAPAPSQALDDATRRFFGRLARYPSAWNAAALERVGAHLDVLRAHGLLAILGATLRKSPFRGDDATAQALKAAHHGLTMREMASTVVLLETLPAFERSGIRVLVCKGEALAAQAYLEPGQRERGDIDLWAAEADFARACVLLEAHGFVARAAADGQWVQTERSFVHASWPQAMIDLHRQPFGQGALDAALDFEGCFARGEPHGPGVRHPDAADALIFAALHRIAHHPAERDRMIWLCDFDMLAKRFPQAPAEALRRAREAGVASLLLDAFASTRRDFDTSFDEMDLDQLAALARSEFSARLLRPMSPLRRALFDLRSLRGARARWGFVMEHFFPSRAYMRWRYPRAPHWAWPLLYPWRAIAGLWRALTR